jgi:hypothetical protein
MPAEARNFVQSFNIIMDLFMVYLTLSIAQTI